MPPLYLALATASAPRNATLGSQHISLDCYPFIFRSESAILGSGHHGVATNQELRHAGQTSPVATEQKKWRKTCRTASNRCWPSVWLRSSQPVQTQHQLKNTLSLIPSRSRKSRSIPVNTSNSAIQAGWASRPAHFRPLTNLEGAA